MTYEHHLYMILYPHDALIASQLQPEQLAQHYAAGSSRYYRGKVIFAEIDPGFRNDFFRIDEILPGVHPHEDGRPKATKYISSYRALEHLDFSAIRQLYLTTQEGYCIGINSAPFEEEPGDRQPRIYVQITPLKFFTLSKADFGEFGHIITRPDNTKSAPTQFFTQLDLDTSMFLDELSVNPLRPSPFPNVHPSILRDAFYELKRTPDKLHKGIALYSSLEQISYKLIRKGFMFASQTGNAFFPMPDLLSIEKDHYKFWLTM